MAGRIVVFGATGYTGSLIAERLVAAGASPVLAGRDVARLRGAGRAARTADAEVVQADAPAPELRLRPGRGGRRPDLDRRPVRQVRHRRRAGRDRRRRDLPGLHGRAAPSSARSSRSSTARAAQERRRAADRAGLRLGAGRAGGGARAGGRGAGRRPRRRRLLRARRLGQRRAPRSRWSARRSTRASASATARSSPSAARRACAPSARARARRFSAGGAEHFTLPPAYRASARGQHLHRRRAVRRAASSSPSVATSRRPARPVLPRGHAGGGRARRRRPPRPQRRAARPRASSPPRTPPTGRELAPHRLDGPDPYDFTATFMAWAARAPPARSRAPAPSPPCSPSAAWPACTRDAPRAGISEQP